MFTNLKKKLNYSHFLCIILFIWNTLYVIEALRIGPPIKKGRVDVTFFPLLISIILYIAIIYVFFISFNKSKKEIGSDLSRISRPTLVVIITIIYIAVFKVIGYMLSSILYIFALISVFETKKRNILIKIFYALIIAVLIYLLYEKIFLIRLPKLGGIL